MSMRKWILKKSNYEFLCKAWHPPRMGVVSTESDTQCMLSKHQTLLLVLIQASVDLEPFQAWRSQQRDGYSRSSFTSFYPFPLPHSLGLSNLLYPLLFWKLPNHGTRTEAGRWRLTYLLHQLVNSVKWENFSRSQGLKRQNLYTWKPFQFWELLWSI